VLSLEEFTEVELIAEGASELSAGGVGITETGN
jgi:hypothetical protein